MAGVLQSASFLWNDPWGWKHHVVLPHIHERAPYPTITACLTVFFTLWCEIITFQYALIITWNYHTIWDGIHLKVLTWFSHIKKIVEIDSNDRGEVGVRYNNRCPEKRLINIIQEHQDTEPELCVQQTYKYDSGPSDPDTSPFFRCAKPLVLN